MASRFPMNDGSEFEREIESMKAQGYAPDEGDESYRADLAVADLLSRGRFVPKSGFKQRLRRQLYNRLERSDSMLKPRNILMGRLVRVLATSAIAAVAVLAIVFATAPDAAAQGGNQLLARFVEVASPWLPLERVSALAPLVRANADRQRLLPPASAQPGENVPESAPSAIPTPAPKKGPSPVPPVVPASPQLISLQQAQAKVGFKIRLPSWLPSGYVFKGVVASPPAPTSPKALPPVPGALPPPGAPPSGNNPLAPPAANIARSVILVFSNSSGDTFFLSEVESPGMPARPVDLPAGKGSIQDVTINGQPGQYVEGSWTPQGWVPNGNHILHWQGVDGVMYDLNSPSLGHDTLLQIANSIK